MSEEEILKCKCGNIATIREYYIKGVANKKNYFVKCSKCFNRTRSRNRKYKAIDEWNKYGAKLFYEERGLIYFDE